MNSTAKTSQNDVAKHAEARRLLRMSFKLCELHKNQKRPVGDGWQLNSIKAIDDKAGGYGMPLAANGLCSIDPDNVEPARAGLARCGFDLEELMDDGVRTNSTRPGSGGRSTFRAPEGLGWVKFSSKTLGTILELRAGSTNLQDCLPGTVYLGKNGGGPYEQQYASGKTMDQAPELPAKFLAWWQRCDSDLTFLREQQALLCGADVQLAISTGTGKGAKLAFASSNRVDFNAHNEVDDLLAAHGYSTEGDGRWAPHTATGAPCVRPIPGCDGLWRSDHASDPLCGTFDAWVAFVVLEHGGNVKSAEQAWEILRDKLRAEEFNEERTRLHEHVEHLLFAEEMAGLPPEAYDTLPEKVQSAKLAGHEVDALLKRLGAASGREVAQASQMLAHRSRFRVMQASELMARERPRWHVKGVIPQGELVVLYGASGSGKSFMVFDMVASIARGVLWRDRRVTQGRVVYIIAEGVGGFAQRLAAYAKHHELSDVDESGVELITAAPNLLIETDPAELIREIGRADLIVIDTLAQVTPGANESASEDMGRAIASCKRIHEGTGATVVLVHHSGKDASKGARGWSGLRGAADAELEVINDLKGRRMRLSKSKDGEDGLEWGFSLPVVHLGVDDDLDPITSCVVAAGELQQAKRPEPKGKDQRTVWAVAQHLTEDAETVPEEALIVQAIARMEKPGEGKDRRRAVVRRAITALIDADYLARKGDDIACR